MPKPDVSIIMPSYNARPFIGRAIDSVLGQTVSNFEILVVDDGSTDGTPDFVSRSYVGEERIRLLQLGQNRGPAHARNAALAEATGTWIALIDADDAWRPERLERLLATSADADAVFDNLAGYDAYLRIDGGPIFSVFPQSELTIESLVAPRAPHTDYDFGYLKPMIRRKFLSSAKIAYDERLRSGEDMILYLTMLLGGARTKTLDWPGYLYTTPVSQVSGAIWKFSTTRPRDDELRAVLEELAVRYRGCCSESAEKAIAARISYLEYVAPLAKFYYARLRRDYATMLLLALREPRVRREIVSKFRERIPSRGSGSRSVARARPGQKPQ